MTEPVIQFNDACLQFNYNNLMPTIQSHCCLHYVHKRRKADTILQENVAKNVQQDYRINYPRFICVSLPEVKIGYASIHDGT